jgi:hypothetical protein
MGLGSLNWLNFRRIAVNGIPGQATVVELLPKIHNTVRYQYEFGGQFYQGQTQSWQPNPPLDQLHIGQSLVIYFDPKHPEESVLGDPKPMLRNETISVALAAFVIPTLLVVGWAWKSTRNRKRAGLDPVKI